MQLLGRADALLACISPALFQPIGTTGRPVRLLLLLGPSPARPVEEFEVPIGKSSAIAMDASAVGRPTVLAAAAAAPEQNIGACGATAAAAAAARCFIRDVVTAGLAPLRPRPATHMWLMLEVEGAEGEGSLPPGFQPRRGFRRRPLASAPNSAGLPRGRPGAPWARIDMFSSAACDAFQPAPLPTGTTWLQAAARF